MANKRMFSREVVESDSFLDMGVGSRCLYYDLGMQADSKGFVTPKKVMRMTGATVDDLNVLIAKHFVIPFESGVVVITHWNVHNNIRLTREAPSQYEKELGFLIEGKDKQYKLQELSGSTPAQLKGTELKLTEINLTESNAVPTPKPLPLEEQIKELKKRGKL